MKNTANMGIGYNFPTIFKRMKQNTEFTYEDWIIEYCDKIIELSILKKELDPSFIYRLGQVAPKDKLLVEIDKKGRIFYKGNTVDDGVEFDQKINDNIFFHLLSNQYFVPSVNKYLITDKGLLCHELGGHKYFIKHRRRELGVLKHQFWVNIGLLIIGLLSIIMPFIVEWTKPNKPTEVVFSKTTDSNFIKQTEIFDSIRNDIKTIKDSLR